MISFDSNLQSFPRQTPGNFDSTESGIRFSKAFAPCIVNVLGLSCTLTRASTAYPVMSLRHVFCRVLALSNISRAVNLPFMADTYPHIIRVVEHSSTFTKPGTNQKRPKSGEQNSHKWKILKSDKTTEKSLLSGAETLLNLFDEVTPCDLDDYELGIKCFDTLTFGQKIFVLTTIGNGLFRKDVKAYRLYTTFFPHRLP